MSITSPVVKSMSYGLLNFMTAPATGSGNGESSSDPTQTVTVGYDDGKLVDTYGFDTALSIGAISPTTVEFSSGDVTVTTFSWYGQTMDLIVSESVSNEGWTSVDIAGASFDRTAASFDATAKRWRWSSIITNPFGTVVDAEKTITWTI